MPAPPGVELGPAPPPTPRRLPEGFAFRQRFSGNIATIIGAAFTAVGSIMGLAMIAAPGWALMLPACILIGGISALVHGLQTASRTLDAFRHGKAVQGHVSAVAQDLSTKVNGQSPWIITYTFELEGHAYEGKAQTFDTATSNRMRGNPPVWVLVMEGNAERNTMYPPLK
jgi:hypothetical protein